MAQLILSAASAVGKAGVGTILARTVASTAAAYAAGVAERLLFGPRKRTVEGPRVESFQIQSSTEGAGVTRVFGRARVAGQLVWAARFKETVAETSESSGGKGGRLAASKTTYKEYLYSLSFAVGLCEGPIDRVARVWADGKPFDLSKVNHRVYRGTEDQTPDDLIDATEGANGGANGGTGAPAFRGLAYIVFEDLPLKDFGNRIPQLSFEIEKSLAEDDAQALENALRAVTIIPGSGEFVYGATKVTLAATATTRAAMGKLESAAPPAVSGRFDERTIRVRLSYGALASRSAEEVFAGANAAAIETAEGWEILQFRDASLDADGAYALKGLLRGQSGTEKEAGAGAAAGARFVLLTAAVGQAALPFDLRGLALDWSAGPADDAPTEETFRTKTVAGTARGLKPWPPVHFVAVADAGGLDLSWKRRTRIGGDSWEGEDVPLSEAFERYRVEIWNGAALVRSAEVSGPAFAYTAAMIAADFPPALFPGGRPPLKFRVAQISDLAGPGGWGEAMG